MALERIGGIGQLVEVKPNPLLGGNSVMQGRRYNPDSIQDILRPNDQPQIPSRPTISEVMPQKESAPLIDLTPGTPSEILHHVSVSSHAAD